MLFQTSRDTKQFIRSCLAEWDHIHHRRLRFRPESPQCVVRKGLLVTALPRSLVDAWPLLPVAERRPLLLDVSRRGLVVARDLSEALAERPNVGGHRALAQTIELIEDGCQSELEAHGVLTVPGRSPRPREARPPGSS